MAISYSGTFMKLYINGLLIAASASPNTFAATNQRDLYIGGMACWPYFFSGDLDDFRFYNRDLTDDEVKATFIAENGTIQSVRAGNWLEVNTWSCNCIPTVANPVLVKHMVQIPANETGYAYTMKEILGGQVVLASTAKLQLTHAYKTLLKRYVCANGKQVHRATVAVVAGVGHKLTVGVERRWF